MHINSLPPDPWKALGLTVQTADKAEIRSAYRKRVLQCHPDKVQDEALKAKKQEEFQAVQQAYELLSNDVELAEYTELLRLNQLRKQAEAQSKSKVLPNTSSPRSSRTYVLRTAEPPSRSKTFFVPASKPVFSATYSSAHSHSNEDVPIRTFFTLHDNGGERRAQRTQSYENTKPPRGEEEKREKDERRRRKDRVAENVRFDRDRERERAKETMGREAASERERERERQLLDAIRKAEKKERDREREKAEKERDRLRKQGAEEKARSRVREAYKEEMPKGEEKAHSKSAKRSSSRKHDDTPERESAREQVKSSPRRSKSPSPVSDLPVRDKERLAFAAQYIHGSGTAPPPMKRSQTASGTFFAVPPATAPTPPTPAVYADEDSRRGRRKATGRRASVQPQRPNEQPAHRSATAEYNIVDVEPPRVPSLSKAFSSPPVVPTSPPRGINRSQTDHNATKLGSPVYTRSQTWTAYPDNPLDAYPDNDEEGQRTSRTGYRVEAGRTVKISTDYFTTGHATCTRYGPDTADADQEAYVRKPWKVKTARYDSVAYSNVPHSYYAARGAPHVYS